MHKQIILFMASDQRGDEARAIEDELRRSGYRERFQFQTRWAAQPLDLLREVRTLRPSIIHFCGRGGTSGLYFQTQRGDSQLVAPGAIAEAIAAAGSSVRLAVLSRSEER